MSGECDKCSEHCLDCECENKKEIFVLFYISPQWKELIGVYSTEERCQQASSFFTSRMNGACDLQALQVIKIELDEILIKNKVKNSV